MELSTDQQQAVDGILDNFSKGSHREVLGGFAGAGKTTIIRNIIERFPKSDIRLAAPSGKAASVLSKKLDCRTVTTCHSLAYNYAGKKKKRDDSGEVISEELIFTEKSFRGSLVVIDEASMVGKSMHDHIVSMGVPILWVGDPGQLQPVKAKSPGLFDSPSYVLSEIHRNAGPISHYANDLRHGKHIHVPFDGVDHVKIPNIGAVVDQAIENGIGQLLTATNDVRKAINKRYKDTLGFPAKGLHPGMKLICCRNHYQSSVMNGEIFKVANIQLEDSDSFIVDIERDGDILPGVRISKIFDTDVSFDYMLADLGYAITCHKSQGSEWGHVGVVAYGSMINDVRWSYTAVTRAADRLTIFKDERL